MGHGSNRGPDGHRVVGVELPVASEERPTGIRRPRPHLPPILILSINKNIGVHCATGASQHVADRINNKTRIACTTGVELFGAGGGFAPRAERAAEFICIG